jgi:hypothetical protein
MAFICHSFYQITVMYIVFRIIIHVCSAVSIAGSAGRVHNVGSRVLRGSEKINICIQERDGTYCQSAGLRFV